MIVSTRYLDSGETVVTSQCDGDFIVRRWAGRRLVASRRLPYDPNGPRPIGDRYGRIMAKLRGKIEFSMSGQRASRLIAYARKAHDASIKVNDRCRSLRVEYADVFPS